MADLLSNATSPRAPYAKRCGTGERAASDGKKAGENSQGEATTGRRHSTMRKQCFDDGVYSLSGLPRNVDESFWRCSVERNRSIRDELIVLRSNRSLQGTRFDVFRARSQRGAPISRERGAKVAHNIRVLISTSRACASMRWTAAAQNVRSGQQR